MAEVVIPYVYREAFLPFHQRTQRDAVLVCHRRMGKTVALTNDLQLRCLSNQRQFPPPRYAFFYPTRVRAKDIAWPYLKHFSERIPGRKVIESELAIEYPHGGRVTLYGADGARGVGLWLDGAVFDEADDIPQKVVADVTPALSDHQGWTVFAGMLRGRYNLWKRYESAKKAENAYTLLGRVSETGIIPPDEQQRLLLSMGEAAYEMQMECNPNASIANAIYGVEMDACRRENRITRLAIDKTVPLDFFFDIGHSLNGDDWSCWAIQLSGRDILAHQYFACSGKMPAYYAAKCREIADGASVPLGTVYLPHDGNRMDRMGNSAKTQLEAAGLPRVRVVTRTPEIWNGAGGINTLRALLARFYFDETHCAEGWFLGETEMPSGIDCLDYYSKKIDEKAGLIQDVPVHNQYSHGADALRTFSAAYAHRMLEGTSDLAVATRQTAVTVTRDRPSNASVRRYLVSR